MHKNYHEGEQKKKKSQKEKRIPAEPKKNFQYNEKVMIFIEYFINEVKVIECAEYQQASKQVKKYEKKRKLCGCMFDEYEKKGRMKKIYSD